MKSKKTVIETPIRNCPCCGSSNVKAVQQTDTLNPNATWIECGNCGLMTDTYYDDDPAWAKGKAAMLWNTRMPVPAPEVTVDELAEMMHSLFGGDDKWECYAKELMDKLDIRKKDLV